jgi:hypothetical protein
MYQIFNRINIMVVSGEIINGVEFRVSAIHTLFHPGNWPPSPGLHSLCHFDLNFASVGQIVIETPKRLGNLFDGAISRVSASLWKRFWIFSAFSELLYQFLFMAMQFSLTCILADPIRHGTCFWIFLLSKVRCPRIGSKLLNSNKPHVHQIFTLVINHFRVYQLSGLFA